jgi:outer membrane protein OmpA-like peptidoglycan-associated protein
LTRKGRRAAKTLQPPQPRARLCLLALTMGAAALAAAGCSTPAPEYLSGPLIGFPTPAGVQQVRDVDGLPVFEPCNPCAGPTVKTPVQGGYSAQDLDEATSPAPAAQVITLEMLRSPQPTPTAKQPIAAAPKAQATQQPVASVSLLPPVPPAAPAAPKAQPATAVPFAFATSRLSPEGLVAIPTFAEGEKAPPAVYVRGATDDQGSMVANVITSYCTSCYRASNDTEAGRQANRRVELSLTGPTSPAEGAPKR